MAYFLEAMLVSGSVSVWDYTTHRISMEIIIRASTEMTYEAWILILFFFPKNILPIGTTIFSPRCGPMISDYFQQRVKTPKMLPGSKQK